MENNVCYLLTEDINTVSERWH